MLGDGKAVKLKIAPHLDPRLRGYDYTLYVEGLPDLREVADAVVTSLSRGAFGAASDAGGFLGGVEGTIP